MLETSRRQVLCEQGAPDLTGIDFVEVVDPSLQTLLRVFFIVDPREVDDPSNPGDRLADSGSPFPQVADPALVTVEAAAGHSGAVPVEIVAARWILDLASDRVALEVEVAGPGDFSIYELEIQSTAVDRFFRRIRFSFKGGCPSPFDCKDDEECPEEEERDVAIDYLARDFESYRQSLLDFAAREYPDWRERIPPDVAVMLAEVMSALADELAYVQDAHFAQGFLETATQPRALMHLARRVDHRRDPGANANAMLSLRLSQAGPGSGTFLPHAERIPVWAGAEWMEPIAFELGAGLGEDVDEKGDSLYDWVHSHWNGMPLHVPDPDHPCLEIGATEAFLSPLTLENGLVLNQSPLAGALPGALPDGSAPGPDEEFWVGRRMMLRSTPSDPSDPHRTFQVTISEVEITEDALSLDLGGPRIITRIVWDEALPFQLPKAATRLLGNVVEATAGRTESMKFRVGPDDAVALDLRDVQPALEREGPLDEATRLRTVATLFGLDETGRRDLAWTSAGRPELRLRQVDAFEPPRPTPVPWEYRDTLLDGDEQNRYFTLEPGLWKPILRYERQGEVTVHADYAGPTGFTIRFGDGFFGRRPDAGDLFEVDFRVHPGEDANLPADSVTGLAKPSDPAAGPHPALSDVVGVTNPLPATGGRPAETAEYTRTFAPELYKSRPLRAVVNDDYREILGRLPWVQEAGARARFTGSWITRFATADPRDGTGLDEEQFGALESAVECIRQAGREVHVVQPKYAPIDLRVTICIEPGFYPGQVREAVVEALSDEGGGFFDPNAFSFGDPLRRSELEATIQCVPGVLGVESLEYRRRGMSDWASFDSFELVVAPFEIIQVRNDPRFPAQGSISVELHGSGGAP